MGLCSLMGGSGMLHFLAPGPYRRIVPVRLRPWASEVVAISGACEVTCAALLSIPRTRRLGGLATAALLVGVFPANVQMALDGRPGWRVVAPWARLPFQIPLVMWALGFWREG
jgi:uncharacterized membrane protein